MAAAGTRDPVILAAQERAAAYRRDVERTDRLRGRTPGERMVELLAQERAAGTPFEEAWPRCLRLAFFRFQALGLVTNSAERRDWREALVATRESWRRAYDGERAAGGEDAVARIAA